MSKLRCPLCGEIATKVTRTTASDTYILRRRECSSCDSRFSTKERVLGLDLESPATSSGQSGITSKDALT